jgi:hypothetical protein
MYKLQSLLLIGCTWAFAAFCQPAATVLRIDPAQALGGKATELFDSVGYILLETQPESIFGKIDQLFITEDYYIILDHDTNCILFFFKNGKFHCKIKGNAMAKTDRPYGIPFFAVDRQSKEISFKLDSTTNALFDFNGKKIREDRVISNTHYCNFSDHRQVYSDVGVKRNSRGNPAECELRWLDRNRIYRQALPFLSQITAFTPRDYLLPVCTTFSAASTDSMVYYSRCYDYTIYQLGQNSFSALYSFVLPANISLPLDFRINPLYKDHRFEYVIRQHPDVVYNIAHFFQLGNLLFFQLENAHDPDHSSFMYSASSGTLYAIDHIESDSANGFLPIFHNQGSLTFSFSANNFLFADTSFIYTSASAADMLSAAGGRTHLVRTDNPVIIQLRPKQTL